jgi:replicative DNA helicase
MRIEQLILGNLIYNEDYFRKVLPFIKDEYFTGIESIIFKDILFFSSLYNSPPSKEAISISIKEKKNLTNDEVEEIERYLDELGKDKTEYNEKWLLDKTEEFCQEKAIYNSVLQTINILEGKDKVFDKGAIPKLLSDALAVSFDSSIGHDYLENSDQRYDFYHRKEEKIPFDLELFNKITKGGMSPKSLVIALAGTGVGKSLFMCHVAAGCMVQGKNVLYITLEMSEEKIAERIDANLLNVTMDELAIMPKDTYDKKVEKVRNKTIGKLIIKEYPTASASATHFRNLINELHLKRNFRPDIIFIDYLNICTSSRIKPGGSINSYTYVKSIAEELRGLAVEYNLPIVSATQTTRAGFNNSDPGLEDTSESFGLPATADLMFALISSDELNELNQIMVKQLKNRYSDPNYYKRFTLGIDRPKMRLYDSESSGQTDIVDHGHTEKPKQKNKFEGFKV